MLSSTISKTYLLRTISILSPVRSTSEWRMYGAGMAVVWLWCGVGYKKRFLFQLIDIDLRLVSFLKKGLLSPS